MYPMEIYTEESRYKWKCFNKKSRTKYFHIFCKLHMENFFIYNRTNEPNRGYKILKHQLEKPSCVSPVAPQEL